MTNLNAFQQAVARVFGAALAISGLGWSTSALAQSCSPGETASTFSFTGAGQSVAVPADIYSATVYLNGAQGGDGKSGTVGGGPNNPGGAGGLGATVSGRLTLLPGDVLAVGVGGRGSLAVNPGGANTSPAGGGNGGGATDIRLNGNFVAIAAGGGGGGGGWGGNSAAVPGGAGGNSGASGSPGSDVPGTYGPFGAGGGTAAAGGAAGIGCSFAAGTAGLSNGNGGTALNFAGTFDGAGFGGGGGGGGVVGAGGGGGGTGTTQCSLNINSGGGGGAGGTSIVGTLNAASVSEGVVSGNGSVLICFAPDTEAPVVTAPANVTVANAAGQNGATVSYPPATATDNSGHTVTLSYSHPSGSFFPIGTTTVAVSGSDPADNVGTATFTVTVNDTEAPVLTTPSNIVQATDAGQPTATIAFPSPSASDNSGQTPTVTFTPPAGQFPIGTTQVTLRATDGASNFSEVTFSVTVNDTEAPGITPPANIVQAADSGQSTGTIVFAAPIATDNSGQAPTVTFTPPAGQFPIGMTQVTLRATDGASNFSEVTFSVTINDAEAPVITPPANIVQSTDAGQPTATITFPAPVVADNSGQAPPVTFTPPAGQFPIGTSLVTVRATDDAGNFGEETFTVTVNDTEAPVVVAPANIVVPAAAGQNGANVSFTVAPPSDNSGTPVTVSTSPVSGSFFTLGVTTVTIAATDQSTNTGTASFTVTVNDAEAPVISNVPANIMTTMDPGQNFATVSWTIPTVADNDQVVSFTSTNSPGDQFPLGVTSVTYTAIDQAANRSTASFTITVSDGEPPVIVGLPADISSDTDAGQPFGTVNWTAPTATDNAPGVTLTSSHNPGDQFPIGTTTVSYTATDANSNVTTESFVVTVTDNEAPVIAGLPSDITADTDAGQDFATVTWTEPTATDNAPAVTLTSSHAPGDQFAIGTTNVSYTATDANGNTTTASFAIIVNDAQPPVFTTFPSDIEVAVDFPATAAVASWEEPTASDNLPGVTVTQTAGPASGSSFPLGVTTVSYEARDAAGSTVTDSFAVTVNQTAPGGVTFEFSGKGEGIYAVSSADPEFNFSLNSTGGLVSQTVTIRPGTYNFAYTVPGGNGVDAASCTSGGTIDATDMRGTLNIVSGGQITCSVTTINSRDVATGMIGEFLQNRSALILENGPDVARRLERLTGAYTNDGGVSALGFGIESAQLPFNVTLSESDAKFSYSLRRSQAAGGAPRLIAGPVGAFDKSDRLNRGDAERVLDERFGATPGEVPGAPQTGSAAAATTGATNVASTPAAFSYGGGGGPVDPMQNRFDIWVEGRMAAFNSKAGDGKFSIVHAGMDYLFTPSILAGIGVQVDWTSQEGAAAGSEISGTGYMVGPYMTARLSDAFYFDARAAWGQSFNQISPLGTFEDEFDAQRWLVTGALIGQYSLTEAWKVRPELRLSYFRETSDAYTDSLGVSIPSVSVETGTLEFGPTFTTEFQLENGFAFAPFFTVEGIWTFFQENTATAVSSQPGLAEEGVRAKGEIGGTLTNGNGLSLSGSLSYDGIGSDDYEAWGGKLRLGATF